MKLFFKSLFMILIAVFICCGCSKTSIDSCKSDKVKEVVVNEKIPVKNLKLKVRETKSVKVKADGHYTMFFVKGDYTYAVEINSVSVRGFDNAGNEVIRFSGKGNGPGEFTWISGMRIINNIIYIYNGRKFALFNPDGSFVKEYRLKNFVFPFEIIGPDKYLGTFSSYYKKGKKSVQKKELALRDFDLNTINEYISGDNLDATIVKKNNFRFSFSHGSISPGIKFAYLQGCKRIVYGISDQNKLYVSDLKGNDCLVINRNLSPVIIKSDEEKNYIVSGFKNLNSTQKDMIFKNMPLKVNLFTDIMPLRAGFFLVKRMTGVKDSVYELFSPEGKLLYHIEFPFKKSEVSSLAFTEEGINLIKESEKAGYLKVYAITNLPEVYPVKK